MTTARSRGDGNRSAVPYTAENPNFRDSLFTDTMIHDPSVLTRQYNDINNINNNNNDNDNTIPKTFFNNDNNNDNNNSDIDLSGNASDADSLPKNWWYSYNENNNNEEVNNNISSSNNNNRNNNLSHNNSNSLASDIESETNSFFSAHYGNIHCSNHCNVCHNNNNDNDLPNSSNNNIIASDNDSFDSAHYENTHCNNHCNVCHKSNNNNNSISDSRSNGVNVVSNDNDSFDSAHYENIICTNYCFVCHNGMENRNRNSLSDKVENKDTQEDNNSTDSVPTFPPPKIPWQTVWISSNSDLSLSQQHDYESINEIDEDPNYLSAIKTEFPQRHSTMDPSLPANNRPLQPHEHYPTCRFYQPLPLVSRVPKLEYLATLAHNSVIKHVDR